MKTKIWIVDDDLKVLNSLQRVLEKEGYQLMSFTRPEFFLEKLKTEQPEVAIVDIFFNNSVLNGVNLIKTIFEEHPLTQTLVISGETDMKKVLNCLQNGALDFLGKPVSLPRLLTSVRNAVTLYESRFVALQRSAILGKSQQTTNLKKQIIKLAALNDSVLICGESGTGKELVAENLHLFSSRSNHKMYKVNCAALNPNLIESELFGHKKGSFTGAVQDKNGYFVSASGSTLLIDEIGDFDINLQSKLLRVLQERKLTPVGGIAEIDFNTRVVFATHQNLPQMLLAGFFREDLYYRISTFTLKIPPLRDRLDDIDILATHYLNLFLSENNLIFKEFSSSAISKLKEHNYPGNVRELIRIIKNAALHSETETIYPDKIRFENINSKDDIWQLVKNMKLTVGKNYFEKEFILKRLASFDYNVAKTAESFGLIRNNLYRKLKQYTIEVKK
jgi:two-component system, NtrC family, nitrogen regulation response regulator NtrX